MKWKILLFTNLTSNMSVLTIILLFSGVSMLRSSPLKKELTGELLDSVEILHYKPTKDDADAGLVINELMPFGGDDEVVDGMREEEVVRPDFDKALVELVSKMEATFAPSDESYEHFSKMSADDYTMEDVEKYERRFTIATGEIDKRWPNKVVPYEFDDEIANNQEQQEQIYAAMQEWEEKTCIDFKPYSHERAKKLGHNQRIRLVADQKGCLSKVGKQGEKWGTPQNVSLERNGANGLGCMHKRVIMHELGHCLGFHHEQTRWDRDKYLYVFRGNVEESMLHNYEKVKGGYPDFPMPYDYLSIMQYGKDVFGKVVNGKKLITELPKEKCYTDLMGKAWHLSYYDHMLMNIVYGCNRGCGSLRCGKNCYATKSGEDPECHCVCLDNSHDPCKGGSCFLGERFSNCPEMVENNPSWTCSRYKEECCESCKGVTIDPVCPAGDTVSNCAELIAMNPSGVCYRHKVECCESCKGVTMDPRCPTGNEVDNCDKLIDEYGQSIVCQELAFQCCFSCL